MNYKAIIILGTMLLLLVLSVSLFMIHEEPSVKLRFEEGFSNLSGEFDKKHHPRSSQNSKKILSKSNAPREVIIRNNIILKSIITQPTEDPLSVIERSELDTLQAQPGHFSQILLMLSIILFLKVNIPVLILLESNFLFNSFTIITGYAENGT